MSARCWVNGVPDTCIAVDDRGLQYGDGVFETMPVREGRIALLDYHLQRLAEGCKRLAIPLMETGLISDELALAAKGHATAVLKLIVTRGRGGRGYRAPLAPEPVRILSLHDHPIHPEYWRHEGVRLRMCETRLGSNTQLAGVKHLNRLEQVLARAEWSDDEDIQEGLMTDNEGRIIEGTMSNVFVCLADGTWVTPDLQHCGVAGVVRRYLLDCAGRQGTEVQIRPIATREIRDAKEMFVCNSVIGVWPVRQLDEMTFEVGEMTRQAQKWMESL